MIQDIIWDVGGTLFDTYPCVAQAFDAALREIGESAPLDQVEALAKCSTRHCVVSLAQEFNLDPDQLEQSFHRYYVCIDGQSQPPFPGVKDVCAYICARGGRNFILTHRGWPSLEMLLRTHQMAHFFTDAVTREDPFPRKPDPAAFEYLIQRHNINRAQCLTVGDREIDILAGKAAHIRTCFFGEAPHQVRADLEITDFATLLRWLKMENGET